MKDVKKVFALVALFLGFSVSAAAQDGLTLRVGGNFPVGAFGEGGKLNALALRDAESSLGGAAIGYNAGLKYQLKVVGGLSAFASADFFYNGLKEDIREDVEKLWQGAGEDIVLPSYMNAPLMLGLNYGFFKKKAVSLWIEAGAGCNFRSITDNSVEWTGKLPLNEENSHVSSKTSYEVNTTFAWQAGLGVSLVNTITLGLHYYGFGDAPVNPKTDIGDNVPNWEGFGLEDILGEIKEGGKLNPSMLVVRLGFTF